MMQLTLRVDIDALLLSVFKDPSHLLCLWSPCFAGSVMPIDLLEQSFQGFIGGVVDVLYAANWSGTGHVVSPLCFQLLIYSMKIPQEQG
jgi:hypothetical protein